MGWKIPKLWEGGECWIIGGGPSIPREFGVPESVIQQVQTGELPVDTYSPYLSPIHDKHVIAVNAAFMLGNWIDLVFFGDIGFYFNNRNALAAFPRPKVACHDRDTLRDDGVKIVVKARGHLWGISPLKDKVSWNKNSGGAAISLAYQLGAVKIYLLGFDMDLGQYGNQHFHRHYMEPGKVKDPSKTPFARFLPAFPKIAADAKKLGVEIINVSQTSKIGVFPKMTIEEIFG